MTCDKRIDNEAERVRRLMAQRPPLEADLIAPSADHKTPDLLVRAADVRVLIEVEKKADDKQLRDLLDKHDGAILRYSGARTEERIEHGFRQVRDYPDRQTTDHTLVWFVAGDRNVAGVLSPSAARSRLYGLERLEGYTNGGSYYSKLCYFVRDSVFFRRKELDAVIVETFATLDFCLNPFSPRFAALRDGPFLQALVGWVSLVDPAGEEAKGKAFGRTAIMTVRISMVLSRTSARSTTFAGRGSRNMCSSMFGRDPQPRAL